MGGVSRKKNSDALVAGTIDKLRKKFGADAAVCPGLGPARSQVVGVLPTNIEVLDRHVVLIGGLPLGRLVEVFGEEGSGKSSFVLSVLASCLRAGGIAVYVDTEHSFDEERAKTFGIDLTRFIIIQPESMEKALEEMRFVLDSLPDKGGPVIIAWDSIAATPTNSELDGDFKKKVGDRSRLLSEACRTMLPVAIKKQAVLLWVNQVRENIGVMFGDKYTTPGGKAVKFHASLRIQLWSGKALKDAKTNDHVGKTVTFVAVKNRFAPPFRKAKVRLDYAAGWDNLWSTINHAKDRKVIKETLRATPATYVEATKALGWPEVAARPAATTESEEDSSALDGAEVREWSGDVRAEEETES